MMSLSPKELVEHSITIAEEYRRQGLNLTLRQLYYQHVARGLTGSGQKVYNRLGAALTKARYDGRFPVEWLCDRGRSVESSQSTGHNVKPDSAMVQAERIIGDLPHWLLKSERWVGQPIYVSVWVEKEALAGVFEPVTQQLGVGMFACKGYPSVSALYQWLEQADRAAQGIWDDGHDHFEGHAERAVVLYFGDHDPDGFEIPRSAKRNLDKLVNVTRFDPGPIEFRRIALNMDQIRQYSPPPFEAKTTSSRYATYRVEHDTEDAWELDALEPTVLRDLIRTNVRALFDQDIYADNQDLVREAREEMRERMADIEWLEEVVGD